MDEEVLGMRESEKRQMTKLRTNYESLAMSAVKDYLSNLELMGKCSFNRVNSGVIVTDKRVFRGARPGTADFECIFAPNGRHVSIEVKSDKGKQSAVQSKYQEKIEKLGGLYMLARSIRDVEDRLKAEGIL